ncbi:MAG: DUF3617 family protein [Desulfobacteraceae bacterium]|nr:DUF3617 family protein [Desulfobacteraceae bacterium]
MTTLVAVCVFLLTLSALGLDFNPGKYEITSKVEMPGMPPMAPQTYTECVSDKNPVPIKNAPGQQCEYKDMKTVGSTITWTMTCNQQGMASTSTGKMVYKGDTFEGSMKTVTGPSAGNMTITSVVTGKRVGDCE